MKLKIVNTSSFKLPEYKTLDSAGMDLKAFSKTTLVQDAVVRQLEIIGEATKRISKKLNEENPQVPWSDMAGMRDVLIHDYIDVDHDIVWRTASESIGELKELINEVSYHNR